MKKVILAVAVLLFASSMYGYRLNRVAESGSRWQQLPVSMTLNPADSGMGSEETQRAITGAMDSWNKGVGASILDVGSINTGLKASQGMDPDAVNAIVFSKSFLADTGFDADVTVAVGGQYGDGSAMSSAFIVFNAQKVGWGTDGTCKGYSYCDDLETISLHELGHVLGLGHSEVAEAAMSAKRGSKINRELMQDDIDGAKFLTQYSVAGGSASYSGDSDQSSGGGGGSGGCGTISTGSGNGNGNGMGGTIAMMLLPLLALGVLRNRVALRTNR